MNKQWSWLLFPIALGGLVVVLPGRAGDFKVEEGYASLFNGKDLTGWRLGKMKLDGKTATTNKKWHVTDGAIVIDGGGGGDLYTVRDFNQAFHLRLEFRAAKRADSGVYIRGTQLQVRDYPRAGPYTKVKFHDGDWNELDITVHGNKALCKCNGEDHPLVVDYRVWLQEGEMTGAQVQALSDAFVVPPRVRVQ